MEGEHVSSFFRLLSAVLRLSFAVSVASLIALGFIVETIQAGDCQHRQNYSTNGTIDPSNMTPLNISMALLSHLGNKGNGKHFSGAFFIAIDDLNKVAVEKGIPVTFNWTFHDARNDEIQAMKEMTDIHCSKNISAFIGPDVYCKSAGLLATGFDIPYITFNCEENHNRTAQLLLVNTEISFVYVSRYIAAVLAHYKWTSFWLITGSTVKWQSVAKHLKASLKDMNISMNGDTEYEPNNMFSQYETNKDAYVDVIQKTRYKTRVYVFLGSYDSLLLFLWQLSKQGITESGKYAVVAADDSESMDPENKVSSWDVLTKRYKAWTENEVMQSVLRNVLIVRPKKDVNETESFEDRVRARNSESPIFLPKPPASFSKKNVPKQAYQLYDATKIYGEAVMALMADPNADPENGTHIINYLRCRRHVSMQGGNLYIHSNGESEGSFQVETYPNATSPHLMEVGHFLTLSGHELKFNETNSVPWVSGNPPVSDPNCGFDENCSSAGLEEWKIGVVVAAVLSVVLLAIISFILGLRHYMYEQKLERLAWKIERADIQILNAGQCLELTTPSRPRKKDSYSGGNQLRTMLLSHDSDSDIISDASCISDVIPLGVYRGTNVVMKQLTRRNLELTRALKKQLQLRKEMTHENINRFIGACVEIPYLYMVTQFCPRRSLQDILRNEDSPLDDMFVTSLVQDLIRGMSFIHDSEIGCHGNLKSSNCLVDSRWTVKIADFGLSALGAPDDAGFDDEKSYRGLLWTAPELLRYRHRTSTTSTHHNHHFYHGSLHNNNNNNNSNKEFTGSQKGDVYSFAIILYELYGKSGPWGHVKMTNKQIIDYLRGNTTPVLRPDTSTLTCDTNIINLIHACWDKDPDLRPEFKYAIRNRFKPIQQGFLKSNIFDNMLAMMEKYANNLEAVVAERTEQLRLEKKMTENLLLRMLPRSVAERLKRGQRVQPEQYEQVSIYFSDIVGFTELSAVSTPMEVVDLLNDLYTCFDSIIEEFDVYKVETIGDAYMVVSGLPIRNGDRHAGEIASMSLLLLEAIKGKQFRVKSSKDYTLKIRIGIHSGPCCAGVVGLKMPRYCLFGDTVNTASRMESTGEALKIHCSSECKKILDKLGGYHLQERGYTEMKGKGSLLTYFLMSEDHHHRYKRISNYKRMGSAGRCVSSSNLDYTGKIYSIGGRSLDYISLMNDRNAKDSLANPRNSIASLNTTLDSTWSEIPEEGQELQLQHSFTSSTLPRASLPKHHNPQMSPIAEDPTGLGDRTLEKTVSYPDSCLHESITSENEPQVQGAFGVPCSPPRNMCSNRRTQSCRSAFIHSTRAGAASGLESFDEDRDIADDDHSVQMRHNRASETRL